jgi:putative acetyltransferase
MTDQDAVTIRREARRDVDAITRVNAIAFGGSEEADIVRRLRDANAVILSLVAEVGGAVVGHILFSPVAIDTPNGEVTAVGLAPMAVLPEHQRKRIGSRLVEEGLRELRLRGYEAVVVLGHPDYYPRFGFARASQFGLRSAIDCADEAFMAIELRPGALAGRTGVVRYRPEFGPDA